LIERDGADLFNRQIQYKVGSSRSAPIDDPHTTL
jgi:hypothetical protein